MSKKVKAKKQAKGTKTSSETIAYRLKCAKTANGLSHFIMYGDVSARKALL